MDRIKALVELRRLTELKRDADVAITARLQREIQNLGHEIDRLNAQSTETIDGEAELSAFQRSGRDALWDAWRLGRVRELTMRIAQLRADLERQRQVTRRSVGKNQVVEKLVERHGPGSKANST